MSTSVILSALKKNALLQRCEVVNDGHLLLADLKRSLYLVLTFWVNFVEPLSHFFVNEMIYALYIFLFFSK